MRQPVKNAVQENKSTLALPHSPATGATSRSQIRKKNLERIRHFLPSDYSWESFMEMCDVFQPKWFSVSSKSSCIGIQYAQTKDKAFFGKGKTFAEAYQNLMQDIYHRPKIIYCDIA